MSMTSHHYTMSKSRNHGASRWTYWTLVLVIVAVFMALTFGDAGGASLL